MVNEFFLILVGTGLIFIVLGFILLKFPPKKINGVYGYRTSASKQNQKQWDFAQLYAGKEMMKTGGVLVLISFAGLIFKPSDISAMYLGLAVILILVFIMVSRVEKAIKSKFTNNLSAQ